MADAAYVDSSVQAAPKAYTLAQSQELQVKAFRAAIDGSAAQGAFLPTLQLIAPSGAVMWESAPTTPVAAGGSADCSWFPGGDLETGGSSGGGSGLNVLYTNTLGASAASIDTGSGGIGAGHGDLIVHAYLRTDRAALQDNVTVRMNGDTNANYDQERLQAAAATLTGVSNNAQTQFAPGLTCPSATEAANVFAFIRLTIPSYATTSGFKVGEVSAYTPSQTGASQLVQIYSAAWRSTAALNQLSFVSATGSNFIAGSSVTIYGTR